ncbi:TPR-like protein [Neoconidiobolus thromboides FSU 785]|nr:TPR-like protein [Neoconidiobolus thromboides FSU 785]
MSEQQYDQNVYPELNDNYDDNDIHSLTTSINQLNHMDRLRLKRVIKMKKADYTSALATATHIITLEHCNFNDRLFVCDIYYKLDKYEECLESMKEYEIEDLILEWKCYLGLKQYDKVIGSGKFLESINNNNDYGIEERQNISQLYVLRGLAFISKRALFRGKNNLTKGFQMNYFNREPLTYLMKYKLLDRTSIRELITLNNWHQSMEDDEQKFLERRKEYLIYFLNEMEEKEYLEFDINNGEYDNNLILTIGKIAFKKGDFKKCQDIYEVYINRYTPNIESLDEFIYCLYYLKDIEGLIRIRQLIHDTDENSAQYLLVNGIIFKFNERCDKCYDYFEMIIDKYPNYIMGSLIISDIMMELQSYERVLRLLINIVTLEKETIMAYVLLIKYYRITKNTEEGILYYNLLNKRVKKHPEYDNPIVHFEMGLFVFGESIKSSTIARSRFIKALIEIEKIGCKKEYLNMLELLYLKLGKCQMVLKEFECATENFSKCLEISPLNFEGLLGRSRALLEISKICLEMNSGFGDSKKTEGYINNIVNRPAINKKRKKIEVDVRELDPNTLHEQSKKDYRQLASIDPTNKELQKEYEKLNNFNLHYGVKAMGNDKSNSFPLFPSFQLPAPSSFMEEKQKEYLKNKRSRVKEDSLIIIQKLLRSEYHEPIMMNQLKPDFM